MPDGPGAVKFAIAGRAPQSGAARLGVDDVSLFAKLRYDGRLESVGVGFGLHRPVVPVDVVPQEDIPAVAQLGTAICSEDLPEYFDRGFQALALVGLAGAVLTEALADPLARLTHVETGLARF